MTLPNQSLILDLLEWIELRPRTYAEALAAWRTSCPRLTIWEDALDPGFVVREHGEDGRRPMVLVTPAGRAFLARWRAYPQAAG